MAKFTCNTTSRSGRGYKCDAHFLSRGQSVMVSDGGTRMDTSKRSTQATPARNWLRFSIRPMRPYTMNNIASGDGVFGTLPVAGVAIGTDLVLPMLHTVLRQINPIR